MWRGLRQEREGLDMAMGDDREVAVVQRGDPCNPEAFTKSDERSISPPRLSRSFLSSAMRVQSQVAAAQHVSRHQRSNERACVGNRS